MVERAAVGIDLGGTKIAGTILRAGGRADAPEEVATPDGADAVLDALVELVTRLAEAGSATAVGIGVAGMVDFTRGALTFAPNLPLRDVPIRDAVAERLALPCVVDNDANTAAWGEYRFGAGRGRRHVLVITVGTGIGGGIIAGGELLRGAHGFAAEIGHFIVEPGGPKCGCGNLGCWEQVASGRALDRLGREEASRSPGGAIARTALGEPVTGRHVTRAARAGDPVALGIVAEVARRLGEGIAGLVNILDPEVVVVGGGVAAEGDLVLDPARRAYLDAVQAREWRPDVPIVPAALGNDAGAIGAAALALDLPGEGAP